MGGVQCPHMFEAEELSISFVNADPNPRGARVDIQNTCYMRVPSPIHLPPFFRIPD